MGCNGIGKLVWDAEVVYWRPSTSFGRCFLPLVPHGGRGLAAGMAGGTPASASRGATGSALAGRPWPLGPW